MASLVATLQNSSQEHLDQLALAWQVTPARGDRGSLIRALIANMTKQWYVRTVLDKLGEPERKALLYLANDLHYWASLDEVAARFRLSRQNAQSMAESLANLGLVVIEDWQEDGSGLPAHDRWLLRLKPAKGMVVIIPIELVPVIAAVKSAIESGDVSHRSLQSVLTQMSSRELQNLAKYWDIPRPHEYSKLHLVDSLLRTMTNAQSVWAVVQAGNPRATGLITALQEKGSKASVEELSRLIGQSELREIYEDLFRCMLIQETYVKGKRFLFIPSEIRVALGSKDEEVEPTLNPVHPEGEPLDSHLAFIEDLVTLLNFVSHNRVELTTTGYIPQRILNKIGLLFHAVEHGNQDSPRLGLVIDIGARLGMVKVVDGRLEPEVGADDWVRLSVAEQVKKVMDTWIAARRFEAGSGLEYYGLHISWPATRSRLLKLMAANCKLNEWYAIESFTEFVLRIDRELALDSVSNSSVRRISMSYKDDVDKILRQFVSGVVAYPLFWLGFVALAPAKGSAFCFRLTPLGAWALGAPGGEPPPEPSEKPLIVQPNFEIIAISAGGQVLRELARFADLRRSDKASVYVLSKESVLRGVDTGLIPDEMLAFLGRFGQKELPQNVAYSIVDWARQYRPLSFSNISLLEVEDENVLSELMASKRFSSFFSRRLSPKAAVLNPNVDLKKIADELRKRGYSPHIPEPQAFYRR